MQIGINLSLTAPRQQGGGGDDAPVPPEGFVFLTRTDGTYLTRPDGAYLIKEAA